MMPQVSTEPLRFGLIGYPLGHSFSPRLHQAALEAMNLAGEYRLYPIPPQPDGSAALLEFLNRMRSGELNGLNVTVPYKQSVIPFLDELTPVARSAGAVNTIYGCRSRENYLVGDNTDVPGFLADLALLFQPRPFGAHGVGAYCIRAQRRSPSGPLHALVLGAGGSARAVVLGLLQSVGAYGIRSDVTIVVAARRINQAEELVSSFNVIYPPKIFAVHLDPSSISNLKKIKLIVNTTPLGMSPNIAASPWPAELPFPPGAAVYDLVYNPVETALVHSARAAGLPARSGLGMLIEQAALSIECWTGIPAPREVMRRAATFLT